MKFKHTDTSYYMHICGLEAFLFTLKMKIYKKHDKGELSKAIQNAENRFASWGGGGVALPR